jgi:septal ring factor EnvC (AmiA/AmiB activator)
MRKHLGNLILLCSFFFYSFSLAQTTPPEMQRQTDELDKIRKELKQKREKMGQLEKEEKSSYEKLQNLEEEIALTEKLLSRIEKKLRNTQTEIEQKDKDLNSAQGELIQRKGIFANRLRNIYKYGRTYDCGILLESSSLLDFFDRLRFLQLVTKQDKELIQTIFKQKQNVQQSKKSLEEKKKEILALKNEKQREEKLKINEKKKKQNYLTQIRKEKKTYAEAIKELEKSAQQIKAIITQLEQERKKGKIAFEPKVFENSKGKLPWPVRGKLSSTFGKQKNPKSNTFTFNPGVDIEANMGEDVVAVASGKVIYSSWLRGYGNFIIIQHDNGYYTLYAHLSEFGVELNEEVSQFQVIGKVGDTGSLSGPGLHFEIRKEREQIDPLEWLR